MAQEEGIGMGWKSLAGPEANHLVEGEEVEVVLGRDQSAGPFNQL